MVRNFRCSTHSMEIISSLYILYIATTYYVQAFSVCMYTDLDHSCCGLETLEDLKGHRAIEDDRTQTSDRMGTVGSSSTLPRLGHLKWLAPPPLHLRIGLSPFLLRQCSENLAPPIPLRVPRASFPSTVIVNLQQSLLHLKTTHQAP